MRIIIGGVITRHHSVEIPIMGVFHLYFVRWESGQNFHTIWFPVIGSRKWLVQTLQWSLYDQSSMHRRWWELCGTAVLCFTGAVHTIRVECQTLVLNCLCNCHSLALVYQGQYVSSQTDFKPLLHNCVWCSLLVRAQKGCCSKMSIECIPWLNVHTRLCKFHSKRFFPVYQIIFSF